MAVEPNLRLLAISYTKPGVVAKHGLAREIFALKETAAFDKFLLCNMAHHLNNPEQVFKSLLACMKRTSLCLVTNLSPENMAYLWQDAVDKFTQSAHDNIPTVIRKAGFNTKCFTQLVFFKCTKAEWYSKLRGRIYSSLQEYSDKEIEEGIAELEETQLCGVSMNEDINLPQEIICTIARPP